MTPPLIIRGYDKVCINNTTGLMVDLPSTRNVNRLEAAILLAIEMAARPNDKNKPIPCKPMMVVKDKSAAEVGLAESRMILAGISTSGHYLP